MTRTEEYVKKEEKKKKIMTAALKVFSKKGYSPAALDEVARRAGIAKGTLYLYFADKEDLFYSTVMFVIDNVASYMRDNINVAMSPLNLLERLTYLQIKFFSTNRDSHGIFHTIINENLGTIHRKLFEALEKKRNELISFVGEVVERGKKEGLIRDDIETREIVESYDGMVISAVRNLYHRNELIDVNKKVKGIMKIFIEGIAR